MYTLSAARELLSSKHGMDNFIRTLYKYAITNMDGFCYQQARLCYYKKGILLVSRYSPHEYCSIYIAPSQSAKVVRGCQDPRVYGDPMPKLQNGNWVCVWEDGRWTKEGPWAPKIESLIIDLLSEIDLIKRRQINEKVEEEKKRLAEIRKQDLQLITNWSS